MSLTIYHVMLMLVVSFDEEINVAPHFDHLDLRNTMMALMTLSASHDVSASASGFA